MKNDKDRARLLKIVYSSLCLAMALTLPFLTGQLQQLGNALCPMHIPVLLCGFLCGWQWGLLVGFVAPLLRFALFGMPPLLPIGIPMAFELAAYGALAGLLYKALPKKTVNVYISLVGAMIGGRLVWGAARYAIAGFSVSDFPLSAFVAGAVTNAVPGMILQLVLVPLLVVALRRAKLAPNE